MFYDYRLEIIETYIFTVVHGKINRSISPNSLKVKVINFLILILHQIEKLETQQTNDAAEIASLKSHLSSTGNI